MFRSSALRLPRLGRWPRLALAACCLLLAVDSALTAHARSAAPVPATSSVVVAARALPAGHLVSSADVRLAQWPRGIVVAVDLRRRADALGHRVATAVGPGEALSSTRLVGRGLTAGLARGQVAVPVQLADAHAADVLHAGERVDLYALPHDTDGVAAPDAGAARQADATVLATGLAVLAVLPGSDATAEPAGVELLVAASQPTALRLTRASVSQSVAAVAEPP